MKKELPVIIIQSAILFSTFINVANFSLQVSRYLQETQPQSPAVVQFTKAYRSLKQ